MHSGGPTLPSKRKMVSYPHVLYYSFIEGERLSSLWLVFILQYFTGPVFMTVSILVDKLDNCFAVHLLEPLRGI